MADRIADLTTDELRALVEDAVRVVLREILVHDKELLKSEARPPLHIPILDVGPWPQHLSLRREDMYGDDGR